MANDKNKKNSEKVPRNKEVVIRSIDFETMSQKTIDDTASLTSNQQDISVKNVRDELKNVIETMGCDGNNDAKSYQETDEEIYSTSTYDSIIQIREVTDDYKKSIIGSSQEDRYHVSDISSCSCFKKNLESPIPTCGPTCHFQPDRPRSNRHHRHRPYSPIVTNQQENFQRFKLPRDGYALYASRPIGEMSSDRMSRFANWFSMKPKKEDSCKNCNRNCDLYRMNIIQSSNHEGRTLPAKFVFDLIDEIPKTNTKTTGTNTRKNQEIRSRGIPDNIFDSDDKLGTERVDVYYFDHGNSEYYRTTDMLPVITTEILAERTEHYTKRFWAHVFGTLHIGVSFIISFFLQLIRFLLQALIRPVIIGLIQLFSDYLIKPFLAVIFNGILQPPLIFLYNLAISLRDVCKPIADSIGYFLREIAILLRAIRLVQIDRGKPPKKCNYNTNDSSCEM